LGPVGKKKEFNMAWIDNQKTFDSGPRGWIEKSVELIQVVNKFKFCNLSMEKWRTQLNLKTDKGLVKSRSIKINKRNTSG
jgi:hypothetical protein